MNRSKTPLLLMEQVLMLLVFAITAAFCVRAFVLADLRSTENAARDHALVEAQSAAESYKMARGTTRNAQIYAETYTAEDSLTTDFDSHWNPLPERKNAERAYRLQITRQPSEESFLGKAEVHVETAEGKVLLSFPLAYQIWGADADA